jgi:hypothetical protein
VRSTLRLKIAAALLLPISVSAQSDPKKWDDATGRYTFPHAGESVQITIERGEVSGYVTRSDHGQTLDQEFERGQLEGDHLTFSTRPLHGETFGFDGTLSRNEGKNRSQKGMYEARGTLTQKASGKTKSWQVTLESLPE